MEEILHSHSTFPYLLKEMMILMILTIQLSLYVICIFCQLLFKNYFLLKSSQS